MFVDGQYEYMLELHRGCSRKCAFCAYSYYSHPYREATEEKLLDKIGDICNIDKTPENKIILTQTSSHHYSKKLLEYLVFLGKLPRYTSSIISDMYKYPDVTDLWNQSRSFFRMGVEGFSERERRRWGKYISNEMLVGLPGIISSETFRLFFIAHLPGQTIKDINEFLGIARKMDDRYPGRKIRIQAFTTTCTYNHTNPIVFFEKKFSPELRQYLQEHRTTESGNVRIKIWKNEPQKNFLFMNTLSLANRKLSKVLAKTVKSTTKEAFNRLAKDAMNIGALFSEYDPEKTFATDHIFHYRDSRNDIRNRYKKILQTF